MPKRYAELVELKETSDALKEGAIQEDGYTISFENVFFQFMKTLDDPMDNMRLLFQLNTAWKIHISVNPEQLATAWDSISSLLGDKATLFKVTDMVSAEKQKETTGSEWTQAKLEQYLRITKGMQVTIYVPPGQETQHQALLEEIERVLTASGIKPGEIDKRSDRVLGVYSSIRHPGEMSYHSSEQVDSYNPDGVDDPFKEIKPGRDTSVALLASKGMFAHTPDEVDDTTKYAAAAPSKSGASGLH